MLSIDITGCVCHKGLSRLWVISGLQICYAINTLVSMLH